MTLIRDRNQRKWYTKYHWDINEDYRAEVRISPRNRTLWGWAIFENDSEKSYDEILPIHEGEYLKADPNYWAMSRLGLDK